MFAQDMFFTVARTTEWFKVRYQFLHWNENLRKSTPQPSEMRRADNRHQSQITVDY